MDNMLQRIFLNGLLLSFLVGYTPCIKGWDISQNVGQKISDSHELLSGVLSLGILSNLLYCAYDQYKYYLRTLDPNEEEIINSHKFLKIFLDHYHDTDVLNFIRTECERAGHPNPEKIEILLSKENDSSLSYFPYNFVAVKTSKYEIILLSETDYWILEYLLFFRNKINSFRKDLFYAGMRKILKIEEEEKKRLIEFLTPIIYEFILVDKKENLDISPFSTSCDPHYELVIKQVKVRLNSEKFEYIPNKKKLSIISNLKKIAYLSDEYLDMQLEKILNIWAASIHHESGHLQSRVGSDELRIFLSSVVPLIAYSSSNLLALEMGPYKRLGAVFFGTAVGFMLSKFLIYFGRYLEECKADNNIVAEERYLLAASKFFLHRDYLEDLSLGFAWQKGFSAFIKHVYFCLTDVHPWSTSRARKCIQRAKKLKQSIL